MIYRLASFTLTWHLTLAFVTSMSASISENNQVTYDRFETVIVQLPAAPVTRIRPVRFWENLEFSELPG